MLFSDSVEALKNQYTDKYVRVNAARPELARFHDAVGQVKTVNMNGRALVEFMDYHLNIGWFDIDPSCLTVVDKPAPKDPAEKAARPAAAAAKPAAAKAAPAAGEKKLSPLELARMQGAGGKAAAAPAKPASGGAAPAKKSTADILAAARGKAAAPAASAPAPTPAVPAPAPAAKPAAPAPAASTGGIVRIDWKSMSTADKIAYCRAKDGK
jgi:hypothetical protein